ncbi:MAG: endonuclease/exonuclease/phosphatase family protein [Pseudomonadota bacterium]
MSLYARHRHGADRVDDRGQAPRQCRPRRERIHRSLVLGLALCLVASLAGAAEAIRIATLNTGLERDAPGLFLRDILKGEAEDIQHAARLIARAKADVILLQGVDWDYEQVALTAFREMVNAEGGAAFTHQFTTQPNAGMPTLVDLDGDGYLRGSADAEGFGAFLGQGGMAVLSRWPVELTQELSDLAWWQVPDTALLPEDPGYGVRRLSSVGHWMLTVTPDDAPPFQLLAFHASPPVFDGPEDLNGRRNRDEILLWAHLLDGRLEAPAPDGRFAILGVANADPEDGDARRDGIHTLLRHDALHDVGPRSEVGEALAERDSGVNDRHSGDPALDTANYADDDPGNLRVDYVLPSAEWPVEGAGILWADPGDNEGPAVRHGVVRVDLAR